MSNNVNTPNFSSYQSSQTSQSSQNLIPLNSFSTQHQTTINPFDAMPEELRLKIVNYLPPKDILNMSLANRRWNLLCNNLLLRRTFTVQGHPRASCFVPKEPNSIKEMYLRCLAKADNFIDNFSPLSELRGYEDLRLPPYMAREIIRRLSTLPVYFRKELVIKLHEIFNLMIEKKEISKETVAMLQIPDPESLAVDIDAEDLNKLSQIELVNNYTYNGPNSALHPYESEQTLKDSIDRAKSIKDPYIRNLALAKIALGCCNPNVHRIEPHKAENVASMIEDPRIKKDIIKHIVSIYISERGTYYSDNLHSLVGNMVKLLSKDKAYYCDLLRDLVTLCAGQGLDEIATKLITMIPVGTAQSLAAYKYLANDLLKREGIRNALEFAEKIPDIHARNLVIKDIKMWSAIESAVEQEYADVETQGSALKNLALTNLAEGKFEIAEKIAKKIQDPKIRFEVLTLIVKEHLKQENIKKVLELIDHFANECYSGRLPNFGILIETIVEMTVEKCIAINRFYPDIVQLVYSSLDWGCSRELGCKLLRAAFNEFLRKAKYSLPNAKEVSEFAQDAEFFLANLPPDEEKTEQLKELATLYLQIGMIDRAKEIGGQIKVAGVREIILKKCDSLTINVKITSEALKESFVRLFNTGQLEEAEKTALSIPSKEIKISALRDLIKKYLEISKFDRALKIAEFLEDAPVVKKQILEEQTCNLLQAYEGHIQMGALDLAQKAATSIPIKEKRIAALDRLYKIHVQNNDIDHAKRIADLMKNQ